MEPEAFFARYSGQPAGGERQRRRIRYDNDAITIRYDTIRYDKIR